MGETLDLLRGERERVSGLVSDQGFAEADANLSVHLVLVAGHRVSGVKHEGVLGGHELHEQRRHAEFLLLHAASLSAEVRSLVPLARPHLLDRPPNALDGGHAAVGGNRLLKHGLEIRRHLEPVDDDIAEDVESIAAEVGVARVVRGGDGGGGNRDLLERVLVRPQSLLEGSKGKRV